MSETGQKTAMAGEFHVMELLFRKGHEPALTLGNAKFIDILTCSPKGNLYKVSVKAIQAGGKWGIGKYDYSKEKNLIFVLLDYKGNKNFSETSTIPDIWIIPAVEADKIKRMWQINQFAIYSYKDDKPTLEKYKNAWKYLD